jgi:transposase
MKPHGTPEQLEKRRLKAIRLLKTGHSYRSVAAQVDASLSSVVRWYQAYQKQGKRALKPKPTPGRPPRLSDAQKKKLVKILLQGPLEAGYRTDLWTLKRIGEVIRKHFGVRYTIPALWKLMRSLGWSCQKPEKQAKERNEAAIRYWKRVVWPRIKKNRKAWSPLGLP